MSKHFFSFKVWLYASNSTRTVPNQYSKGPFRHLAAMHSFTPMAAGNSTCGSVRMYPALQQAACGSRIRFCSLTICLSWYPRSSCPKLSTEGDLALSLQQSGGMLTKRPSEHRYLSAGGSCEFAPGNN